MPAAPLRNCPGSPICPELVPAGTYCPAHARAKEQARGSAHARGYDKAHHADRSRYIRDRAPRNTAGEPVCENCARTAAETGRPLELDHIDGLGPNGPRGHDPANHQLLCHYCHAAKTAAQTNLGAIQ